MNLQLMLQNGYKVFYPDVEEDLTWKTERKGVPGKLTFSCILDDALNVIEEGNSVKLVVDDVPMFYGFVFSKSRSKKKKIKITAYDQFRYLKNKDTYVFEAGRADENIKMICDDYGIRYNPLPNTGWVIPNRIEENSCLIDIMQTALNITTTNSKKLYVLYDNVGRLELKAASDMKVNILLDASTAEDYSYETSIDNETYNRIKLVYDDKSGTRQIFTAEDKEGTMKQWGTLQYYESITDIISAQNKADMLLQLYNIRHKSLKFTGVIGDKSVRAGSVIMTYIDLGDSKVNNYMLVESCTHHFKHNKHTMDLTVRGGEFI